MGDAEARIEERLGRLEQQNAQILDLLADIAASSFSYRGKKLPAQKPDFARVEKALRAAVATPEISALVALDGFEAKEWVAEAKLRDKFSERSVAHMDKINAMIQAVGAECGVPARMSGWYADPADWRRRIGSMVQFGYSREVGYDHENDFHAEREKAESEPEESC